VQSALLPFVVRTTGIEGVGDFDGDGRDDILLRDRISGATALWLMDGTAVKWAGATSGQMTTPWHVESPTSFDRRPTHGGVTRRSR
jgi:hypothetical protein